MTQYDAPNQEVVRPGEPPWIEGDGGTPGTRATSEPAKRGPGRPKGSGAKKADGPENGD